MLGIQLSPALRRTILAMHTSDAWLTFSEMSGPTGMALSLLACCSDPMVERRWAKWGGELGQKHGAGYEYRMTARGRAVRSALETQA